jgi:hypothetical protein
MKDGVSYGDTLLTRVRSIDVANGFQKLYIPIKLS